MADVTGSKSIYVGFDLGRYSVQVSYLSPDMDAPMTAEQVTGSEVFNIPMVLAKRRGVNQWYYGRDAIRYHETGEGQIVDNLLQKAIDGEKEVVEGVEIDAVALLTLFIKRSLSVLGGAGSRNITDIMFTCYDLDNDVVDVMSRVASGLQLKKCNIYFQNYAESIYHYVIHQEAELWRHDVLCSYYDGNEVTNYLFRRNMKTRPIVTFVDTLDPHELPYPEIVTDDARASAYARLDEAYAGYMTDTLKNLDVSCIYLLGDGFKDEWYDRSVKALARNRRIFLGNDMFSRGAAYSLRDRDTSDEEIKKHIYLGVDKLKSNVGMNVLRRGEPSYLAMLNAGISWYDVKCEYEIFLPEDHILRFEIIPLNGTGHIEKDLELINVPEREPDSLRVRLSMSMSDINTVNVHLEDLGFGELFPSSGMKWDLTINLE